MLGECPSTYVGQELIADINIVDQCKNGVMPVSGGLLEQSAYWFELKTKLEHEQSQIERELTDRRNRR